MGGWRSVYALLAVERLVHSLRTAAGVGRANDVRVNDWQFLPFGLRQDEPLIAERQADDDFVLRRGVVRFRLAVTGWQYEVQAQNERASGERCNETSRQLDFRRSPKTPATMTFRLAIASGVVVLMFAGRLGGSAQATQQSSEARLLDYIEHFTGPQPIDCRLSERPTPQTWANTLACIEDAKTKGQPVYTYRTGGQILDAWIVYGFLTTPKGEGYRFSYGESCCGMVPAAGSFEIRRCDNPRLNGRGLGGNIVMCDRPKP